MAKTSRAPKSMMSKPRPSHSKANANGYARRHSRKAEALKVARDSDVYEYQPEISRRGKVALDFDRDEVRGLGAMDDDDGDEGKTPLRARLIGEDMENEGINSEDDEEIDSDGAFEESDEERFAGFKFSNKKKAGKSKKATLKGKESARNKVRFTDVDLNEDEDMAGGDSSNDVKGDEETEEEEEEEEEGDPSEFIDILDILDGKGESYEEDELNAPTPGPSRHSPSKAADISIDNDAAQDSDDDSEAEVSGNDEEDVARHDISVSASDEEADDATGPGALEELQDFISKLDPTASDEEADDATGPGALEELQDFISKLDPTASSAKRKAPGDTENSTKPAKRRLIIKERTEAGAESEFGAFNSSGAQLSIDDLLAPLSKPSSASASALLDLQKSAKVLRPPENATGSKGKSKKPQTLAAPLPHRAQERLDREAAYEQTKEEIHRWNESMKLIREADHLSFPLQPPAKTKISNLELAARFKPTTPLESSISNLLQTAQLREEDIHQTEENALAAQQLSVEEVAARRAELRQMRELAFRAEVRARRVKKIKSKVYRRLRRKEKEKAGANEDDDEDEEAARLRAETERARERATLRHKHTGKWARAMKNKEGLDEDARGAIEDMLERGERLRRKIHGRGSGSEAGSDSEDDGDGHDAESRVKARAFEELAQLDAAEGDDSAAAKKGKGVFEMKFMKDAMARSRGEADRERDDFIRELGDMDAEDAGSDVANADSKASAEASNIAVERVGGRMVFRPGAVPPPISLGTGSTSLASDTSSVTLKSTDFPSPTDPRPSQKSALSTPAVPDPGETNPWLVPRGSDPSIKAPRKKNDVVVAKESAAVDKAKNRLKKQALKREEAKEKARDEATVEISMDQVLDSTSAAASNGNSSKATINGTHPKAPSRRSASPVLEQSLAEDSDRDSEVEEQEKKVMLKASKGKGPSAFEQRDLVALAFAGDNVVQHFEEIKRQEMAADAPREVDTTLPGWGSWGGTGVAKQAPKPHLVKKVAGIDPKSRADFGKAHVIISEKRDKKAAKYLVKDLPYPYTSKAQFERSMDTPVGAEWNTRLAFQRATLPKVVKKMGTVIDPLEKLF